MIHGRLQSFLIYNIPGTFHCLFFKDELLMYLHTEASMYLDLISSNAKASFWSEFSEFLKLSTERFRIIQ